MPENNVIDILIVEDNSADAYLLKHFLDDSSGQQYRFAHAEKLEQAKEMLDGESYDLMFLDLGLPGFFGKDTIHHMADYMTRLPTIILTGNMDKELGMEGIEHGAQNFICKDNYDSQLLRRTVVMAMDNFKRTHS